MEINATKKKQFYKILSEGRVHPVYQAIVSLKDAEIYGYEALSRIDLDDCAINTAELFEMADALNCLWELEELCRKKALRHAANKEDNIKLFINVDPNVINDGKFKSGVTAKYLKKYGLLPEDIIFEITERTFIEDAGAFKETLNHYTSQRYRIAIDDFGTEYAGLNRICALNPRFVKFDIGLIKGIDEDNVRYSLLKSFTSFCHNAGIAVIAEGVETSETLEALVDIGVDYAQGYYLQRPQKKMEPLPGKLIGEIIMLNEKYSAINNIKPTVISTVGEICHREKTVLPNCRGAQVFEYFGENHNAMEITVVDEMEHVCGTLTRSYIMEKFGGRYGYNLHALRPATEFMMTDFLMIDYTTSIEMASKLAMVRPAHQLYDDIVVLRGQRYFGVVTVKDLLEAAVTIQVNKATDVNPLSGLPGNSAIQTRLSRCIASSAPFAVAYLDLDNFKAYNDAYGFNKGDVMLGTVVHCMRNCCSNRDFLGHIGGDDFVIISDYYKLDKVCARITEQFSKAIKPLYTREDWANGCIRSKNRKGEDDAFPIATLSIAIVTNESRQFDSLDAFYSLLKERKKEAKQRAGNSIV